MNPTIGNGRYVLERRLGQGAQAAVYRALDTRFGVVRAVKVLLPEIARRASLRERFVQEARTMARIDHPNVVRVFDVATDGPLPYLVMELLPGGSLADWVSVHGRMPPRLAARAVRDAGLGAVAAHALGIVHRDIKPHNVLLAAEGRCKLTDFGIARVGDSGRTQAGSTMGTQGYMAPEQANDASSVDQRGDVFSLGITLFVLLTLLDPTVRLAGEGLDGVPKALHPVLERATAVRRERRHPDAQAFVAELEQALALLPPDPPAPPLVLPEQAGADIDPALLEGLLDGSTPPRAPAAPQSPPAALPYLVPRREAAQTDRTPDWVDRTTEDSAPRSSFTVGVDAPRPRKPPEPPPPSRRIPTAYAAAAAGLVLLLGVAVPAWHTSSLGATAEAARAAEARLSERMRVDRGGLDAALAIGADRERIEAAYFAWHDAKAPDARDRALLAYVEVLEGEVARVATSGAPGSELAVSTVRQLRGELEHARATRAAYEAQRRGPTGCLAIGVPPP